MRRKELNQPVLTVRKAADVVAKPITWTIDQIVPAGMLTVLSGKDKTGKTLFAWEMARAVITGEPFLNHFPVIEGPVLFLGLDDPAIVTMHRLEELDIKDSPDLYVATPLDCVHTDCKFWDEVMNQARLLQPQLIVVDALYLFLQGGADSMNQAGGMAHVMEPLNELTEETGAGVLLITHDAKAGHDLAGSFVIRAAAKQILRLKGNKAEPTTRSLDVEGKLIEQSTWTLKFDGPGKWALSDEEQLSFAHTKAAVAEWLKQGQRGTTEAIAEVVHRRRADVDMALTQLVKERLTLATKQKGTRGRPRIEYRWNFGPDPAEAEDGRKIIEVANEPLASVVD